MIHEVDEVAIHEVRVVQEEVSNEEHCEVLDGKEGIEECVDDSFGV